MTEAESHTLDAPGCVLHYDVRRHDASTEPVLLLIGSPMGAAGFATLARHFTDRTVVTYDPRGAERSRRTDGALRTTPEEHADDLHRLIGALDAGPVDLFASSGGAVNALALVARHPEQVRTLVAHEPPAAPVLPDAAAAMAATEHIHDTYLKEGAGPAIAKFITLVGYDGEITDGFFDGITVNPADFGLPTTDDGSRDDPLAGQNIVSCTHFRPDFDALRAASTRIVIGVGATSGRTMAARAGRGVAAGLGVEPVEFPGDHAGFAGGEYGTVGEPDAFAATLREVLAG
jgi:pimeloyl-ACP methyl ester carboxylesterase